MALKSSVGLKQQFHWHARQMRVVMVYSLARQRLPGLLGLVRVHQPRYFHRRCHLQAATVMARARSSLLFNFWFALDFHDRPLRGHSVPRHLGIAAMRYLFTFAFPWRG